MTKSVHKFMFVFVLASLILAACGGTTPAEGPASSQPTSPANSGGSSDPTEMYMPYSVSGDIVAAGSSTVFPLAAGQGHGEFA